MSTMPDTEVFVTLGIDTYKHTHLAVALDEVGRWLGQLEMPTTTAGFAQLYAWACELGTIDAETKDLDRQLTRLVTATAPKLVARTGIGIHTTATLPVTTGDNPDRLRSEDTFARLTGTAPIPASSGQTNRFRLSHGGDRHTNAALHPIAVNRLVSDPRSKTYVKKRTDSTKADLDTLRRRKHYTAREIYPPLLETLHTAEPDLIKAA